MSYYNFLTPLVSGQTVRAAPLNSEFTTIQTAFEKLPALELSEDGFASTVFIQDATTLDHAVNLRQMQNWPTAAPAVVSLGINRLSDALDPVNSQDVVTKAWSLANHGNALAESIAAAASAAAALVSENNAASSAAAVNEAKAYYMGTS